MARKVTNSAQGEKAAIGGFWRQYEYSACQIFQLIQEDDFQWLVVNDPDAGILDDLLLGTTAGTLAVQVKRETAPKPIALYTQLVQKRLIQAIVNSWHSLEEKYGKSRIRVRYVFGGYFSSSDNSLGKDEGEGPRHSAAFAAFINEQKLTKSIIAGSIWHSALEEMRALAGLEDDDFIRFLNGLELCDAKELAENRFRAFPPNEREKLEQIRNLLPRIVAEAPTGTKLLEADLFEDLGWQNRITQKKIHDFPVSGDFQTNDVTQDSLLKTIAATTSGYIGLIGAPGTGKSTLLQQGLHSTPEFGVARYLAFMPDQRHGLGRAEASEFLNDLIAALIQLGFHAPRYRSEMLSDLRRELARQLVEAGKRYSETGRKTVIVIDGLDHIPREETPTSSFLKELPPPQTIPDGVIIILGSQHLQLEDLKQGIAQQAQRDDRCISIAPLSRRAIFELARLASLPDFVDFSQLYEATGGHPLTARYFIEALKGVQTVADADRLFSYSDGLGQSLQEIYERVWNALDANGKAKHALGLLARVDGEISTYSLASQVGDTAVEEILERARFLLSSDDGLYFTIFHNSFRLFVAAETRKRFGLNDLERDKKYYAELSAIAEKVSDDDPQFWMQLRYKARAGDNDGVLQKASGNYFRQSLIALRPSTDIFTDLHLTYAAVRPTRDRVLLLNKLLIEKEIEYRLEAFSEVDFTELFLALGERNGAVNHALAAGYGTSWVKLVNQLWNEGNWALSRQVFEANEPLESLFGDGHTDAYSHMPEISEWVSLAHRYRPIERLLDIIRALPFDDRFGVGETGEDEKEDLVFRLALGICRDDPRQSVEELCVQLSLGVEHRQLLEIDCARSLQENGDLSAAQAALTQALNLASVDDIDRSWRSLAASVAYKAKWFDVAQAFLSTLEVPSIANTDGYHGGGEFERLCNDRYVLLVLSNALQVPLSKVHPKKKNLLAALELHIDTLAALRAKVEEGELISFPDIKALVSFIAHAEPQTTYSNEHKFFSVLPWFCEQLMEIASKAGSDISSRTISLLDSQIRSSGNNLFNSEGVRLKFACCVFKEDKNHSQARGRIENAWQESRHGRTPQEVVESGIASAKAFAKVGLLAEAKKCLKEIHSDTFGYWLRAKKEPQYEFWAWAFSRASDTKPSCTEKYGKEFAQFILGMGHTQGDETAMRVIPSLIEGTRFAPSLQAGLFERLIESDLVTWARLTSLLLKGLVKSDPSLSSPCASFFSELVVPFCDGVDEGFINISMEMAEPEQRSALSNLYIEAIMRWCANSGRWPLLETLQTVSPSVVIDPLISKAKQQSDRLYQMAHGRQAKREEDGTDHQSRLSSLEDLLALGDGKSRYGSGVDYDYATAARKLCPTLSKLELEQLFNQRPHLKSDTKVLIECSRAMHKVGEEEYATLLFGEAEDMAKVGSWASFYGGEKLALQKLRNEREGNGGRDKGYDILVEELASGQTAGTSLFLNLNQILEEICVVIPYEDIWRETEQHLQQYREYRLAEPVTSLVDVGSHSDLFAYLLAQAFSFACPEILMHARAAVRLVLAEKIGAEILPPLIRFLEAQPDGTREAIAIIYRARGHKHLREVIVEIAQRYAESEDFVVHFQAEQILKALGQPNNLAPSDVRLPSFYNIEYSGTPQADDFDLPPGLQTGARPVWSDDPWTWTAGAGWVFRSLSKASGIEVEVLRRRCAEFMRRAGGAEFFGPRVENKIISRLRCAGLKFSYRRPEPTALFYGLGRVLSELVKANHIDPRALPMVWPEIGGPAMADFQISIEVRPDWIVEPEFPSRDSGGLSKDCWQDSTSSALVVPWGKDEIVFAERSFFRFYVWREQLECTRVCLPLSANNQLANEDPFLDFPRLVSVEDWRPLYDREESIGIALVPPNYYGDLRRPTITLCPYIISSLSWHRSEHNPLEIYDGEGHLMARTKIWIDGIDYAASSETDVFGDGQFLLLSRSAHELIAASIDPIRMEAWAEWKHIDHSQEVVAAFQVNSNM